MNITHDLQFPTTITLKNQNGKLSKNRFQELVQNCFKRKIRMILFNILESEDSFEHLELIISKATKYSY